jgi:LysM repeat protein
MSLQRGSYGIEYDEQQGSPFRKLWIPAALVLVAILPLLFFRSCGKPDEREAALAEELGQTRYRVPEVETKRERPSLWRHFLSDWRSGRKARDAAADESARGDRWLDAETASPASVLAKVQSPEVKRLLEQAARHETADDLVNARLVLLQILLRKDAEDVRAFAERKIGVINTALVFGDRSMPEKARHRIASGDLVGKLAKRYGNTQAYLLKANGIDQPSRLRIGQEIWVLENPVFELTVSKKTASAVLTLNGQFFKRYETGPGKPPGVPGGMYAVRDDILARLGLRSADADELRILLPSAVPVVVSD